MDNLYSNLRTSAAWKIDIVEYTKNNGLTKEEMRKNLFTILNKEISEVNKIILKDGIKIEENEISDIGQGEIVEIYKKIFDIIKNELDNFYQNLIVKYVNDKEKDDLRDKIYSELENVHIPKIIEKIIKDESKKREINNHINKIIEGLREKELVIEDKGDGGDIVVTNTLSHYLLILSEKTTVSLREHDLNIKVRMGIHVDLGFVGRRDRRRISGNIRDYLERVTNVGSAGDIVLTESAVITIKSLTDVFDNYIYYGGSYPIKHGQFLNIYYYNKDNIGNNKRPKSKDISIIQIISGKNRLMAITIIAFIVIGLIVSASLFFNQLSLSSKGETFETELINKISDIAQQHQDRTKVLDGLFQSKLNNTTREFNPDINNLLDTKLKLDVNTFLNNNVKNKGNDILYGFLAKPITDKCIIFAYKPYDTVFINKTGLYFPWCKEAQHYNLYTSESYYASGPRNLVNTMATKITVDQPDGKSIVIAYYVESLNWTNIIPPLMKNLNEYNVILVDHKGYLSADCKSIGCRILTPNQNFNNNSIKYVTNNFMDEIFGKTIGGEYKKEFPYGTQLLNNWKMYLFSENEIFNIKMHLLLFIIMLILTAIAVYYYLIPRHLFNIVSS